MFRFLCKDILSSSNRTLQVFKPFSTSLRKAENGNQDSFTVQYLINQFGFSMERALLHSSKYINFKNSDKPDSVIAFFKNQGFTDSQIRKMVSSCPRILVSNTQMIYLPKIEFFRSKGVSSKDLARMLVFEPNTLKRSLEKCIVPSFNFIKDFIGSEKDAVLALSREARILRNLESHVKPTIQILLGAGVSRSAIAHLMKVRPCLFIRSIDKLEESLKQMQNMGMDPRNYNYGLALEILAVTCRSTWNKRMEAFKRWGCSEDDVLRSFKICPHIMMISEERLNGIMSLFVHEIGWESSEVVKRYFMFTLSLKKRMIPRWSIYKELLSKGLVYKVSVHTMFQMKEDQFLKMFVNCYGNEAPLLLKLYIEKQK